MRCRAVRNLGGGCAEGAKNCRGGGNADEYGVSLLSRWTLPSSKRPSWRLAPPYRRGAHLFPLFHHHNLPLLLFLSALVSHPRLSRAHRAPSSDIPTRAIMEILNSFENQYPTQLRPPEALRFAWASPQYSTRQFIRVVFFVTTRLTSVKPPLHLPFAFQNQPNTHFYFTSI